MRSPSRTGSEIAGAVAEQLRRGNARLLKAFLEAKEDALSFDQILEGMLFEGWGSEYPRIPALFQYAERYAQERMMKNG